ncbi:MAG: tetratricopeptide repeat protein, partial [Chloroflexota bacterium]|nr:tetratricopeptide repeat protein [Chloroflexota bacterium]
PNYGMAYINKACTLSALKRYQEAIDTYEKTHGLDDFITDAAIVEADYFRGLALTELGRYQEAIEAYNFAIVHNNYYNTLEPFNLAPVYRSKGIALEHLGRKREAQQAHAKAQELGYRD